MKSKHVVQHSFFIVVLVHIGVLTAILYAPSSSPPIKITPPTIQGVIVTPQPVVKQPEPIQPPKPQQPKPVTKPAMPLPKAPPSERAVKPDIQPEPQPAPAPVQREPVDQPATPVIPPHVNASEINNPAPTYPAMSRRLREEGTVLLEILVNADGSVSEMRLKKSSGYERLDDSALRAVKRWRFIPARRGNDAIDYWYELPIEFSLNK